MLRRQVRSLPVPVSLLDGLSYVTGFSVLASYEGIRRVYQGGTVNTVITLFTVGR